MPNLHLLPESASDLIATAGARLLRNRRLMRAPIRLYKARLGFLFGTRMLMLEHIGRKSGVHRYVVLEVIDRASPGTYVVASGFGARAQWYRNIQANPRIRVFTGGLGPRSATAHVLTQAEADAALQAYISRHPRAWSNLKSVIENTLGTPIDDHNTALPMVALELDRP